MPRLSKIGAAALAAFGWTGLSSVTASYLVVGGGGGAGWAGSAGRGGAGGGGAGGYLTGTTSLNPTLSYAITIGAGGSGGTSGNGTNGVNSVFNAITSTGGGGGARGSTAGTSGNSGGSGGGAAVADPATTAGGTGTSGQGNNGGSASSSTTYEVGGGGGGAGATGSAGSTTGSSATGGNGGVGLSSSISGTSTFYAGGGGGGADNRQTATYGTGGNGGGASASNNATGNFGTANLGGGGGSGATNGGNGGSGIVIISYAGAQQFGGGVVTSSGGNTIHTFTTSGTLSPLSSLTASYLIVAGGGSGQGSGFQYVYGGGGGAGGMVTGSGLTIDTNSIYVVTVGAGAAGTSGTGAPGVAGSNSVFSAVSTTAIGGAGGATGVTGGSGAGGGSYLGGNSSGTAGQGNAGGAGTSYSATGAGGGGGGAGAAGSAGSTSGSGTGGAGGAGSASSISGSSVTYAGGGGGGGNSVAGAGGSGGGGAGAISGNNGSSATANTGGGGGGAATNSGGNQTSGNGGSGVVIISYPGTSQLMAGGTVTVAGGNVIHTFTSSGYLTPIVLVNNSLRFRSSVSAYLNRTPTNVATSRRIMTYSAWVKLGILGTQRLLYEGYTSVSDLEYFMFNSSNQLEWSGQVNGGTSYGVRTPAVFRDPSAWYHVVIAIDTTQATDTNRIKIYVNGVQQTGLTTFYSGFPAQNTDLEWNNQSSTQVIGWGGHTGYYDGYMADINMVDGQALTPNSFGTSNGLGVWQPIRYGGSYGTNGFYLPFPNSGAVTANYLVVAGGGGGGIGGGGGGGGAGGLRSTVTATGGGGSLESALTLNAGNSYTVTVGAGGAGGITEAVGTSGSNSVFSTITSTGGGGGSYASSSGGSPLGSGALSGGSGGGGSAWRNSIGTTSTQSNASGTANQGFAGGSAPTQSTNSIGTGGGGGGAGALGADAVQNTSSGNGGAGVSVAITGSSVTYGGGGGGGGSNASAGTGGSGGGGNGSNGGSGSSGTANRGGGGGGGYSGTGGSGGSGVVIVSYAGTPKFTGGVVSQVGGNTIHTFTTSGTLSSGVGSDYSPNGNNWTLNGFSFTSGSTYDSMTDVPTLTSATVANYAVLNPLVAGTSSVLSNGNLTFTNSAGTGNQCNASMFVTSGSYYFEATLTTAGGGGTSQFVLVGDGNTTYSSNGQIYSGGVLQTTVATLTSGDVVGLAFTPSGSVTYYKNGTSVYTGGVGGVIPIVNGFSGTVWNVNFGQRPFAYTPPTGFVSLNTFNLPTPTIGATASTTANKYMDVTTYTGNGGTQSVTNSGSMQPDFLWIKPRSTANSHVLSDSVRGTDSNGYLFLVSDGTYGESTFDTTWHNSFGKVTALNSNGFTVVNGSSSGNVNTSAVTYVGWQWRASNATAVTNTAGSITSTVSANTTAGFSIATFTSPSSGTASFGHGLGVTPSFVIVKSRASGNWICQHTSTGAQYLLLNGTGAAVTDSTVWNSAFTSTVVNIGTGFAGTVNYVAYCFAPVAGYSAFGSYTGNGSTDGPFIFTGFRPRYVMVKRTDSANAWVIYDTARDTSNVQDLILLANDPGAEVTTSNTMDIISNGFKLRSSEGATNGSGGNYIYMAFAEVPYKFSNAR